MRNAGRLNQIKAGQRRRQHSKGMTIDRAVTDPEGVSARCRQTARLIRESCEGSQTTIAQSTRIIIDAEGAIARSLNLLAQHRRKVRSLPDAVLPQRCAIVLQLLRTGI